MASKALKGLTIEIGGDTTNLGKALQGAEKQSRSLSGELRDIDKLLKLDPSSTELLAQKQQVLADAIGSAKEKLDTLREAEKQVQAQVKKGEASEAQYRELQRELLKTENQLKDLEKAARDLKDELNDTGGEADDTAKDVKDVGDESEDAEDKTGKLGEALENGLKVGLLAVAGAAAGAIAGIKGVVESTQEYRNAMGKLDTAFETNGFSAERAYETYSDLQAVLGDTDQAVEASNHLAQLTKDSRDLQKWTDVCTGVYATFGDSLPIEGLTEAANETSKTGALTGALADALNWAGVNEDDFQESLDKCTTSQERQKLILDTLNGLYSDAAGNFREANAEVIAQNEASERLNKAWADIGEKAAPIVTTFTEGIAELLEALLSMVDDVDIEGFCDTIKQGFRVVIDDVLPALIDALQWCIEHFDLIKSAAAGFVAAMAVVKISSFAHTITTTLIPALIAGTAKQHAMNAAAYANPYVALAAAIVAVGTAIATSYLSHLDDLETASREAAEAAYALNTEEQAMIDRTEEIYSAYDRRRKATDESIGATMSEMEYITGLKEELFKLVGANSRVREADQGRVDFILGELNRALGTQYEMIEGEVQRYGDLKASINDVITAKKMELLLAASGDAYVEAIRAKQQAEQDYYTSVRLMAESKAEGDRLAAQAEQLNAERAAAMTAWEIYEVQKKIEAHNGEVAAFKESRSQIESAYETNRSALEGYYSDIGQYETAQRLALEGNTAEAERVLADRTYYMETYADAVGFSNDRIQNTWELQATTAAIEADTISQNFQDGVKGYTDSMVTEATDNYSAAMGIMDGAYDDAFSVGTDFTDGLEAGMSDGKAGVMAKAAEIIQAAMDAARETADSHSPSRKMIALGEDMGEGAQIGLENMTEDVGHAADRQMQRIMDAYTDLQALDGQQSLASLSAKEAAQQAAGQAELAAANSGVLGQILQAIKAGQVITLDGAAVVGGTAGRMDTALGRRRALTAGGAL